MIRVDALQDANFNWQAALTLATCSSLVYQRPRSVVTIMTDTYNFDACEFIDRRETQLFIASKNDRSIISFRGSASITDWIRNLDVLQTDEPSYGNVHAGFYDGYQFVHQQILEVLNDLPDTQQIWVTGHSLGGALASLCVAELASSKHSQIMGCYTYGQPRTGNREFKRFIADQYGDRFFRFVNDDDIVPRIPPFYRHVGHLIHLGPDGSLLTEPPNDEFSGFESIMEADPLAENVDEESISELPSLTEAEFANLKESLASGEGLGFEATGDDSDGSAEGFFPSVSDHLMTEYIRKIRIHERAVSSMTESGSNGTVDIHVDLQASMMSDSSSESEGLGTLGGFESTNEPVLIPVLIRAFASWEAPSHIQINSKVGSIYTALVTADQIDELRADTFVQSVERSSDTFLTEVISSVPFVNAKSVHTRSDSGAEKGDSAIVGIIDSGIDILHEAFTVAGDPTKSRILYIWDQRGAEAAERTPRQVNPNFTAQYGRLYTQSEIEAMMAGPRDDVSRRLRDARGRGPSGHGSHVAGIAAGRAVGMLGDGVAPEAKIAFVIPKIKTEEGDPSSLGYSVTHVDGLLFLRQVSELEALPMVINVSQGMNAGSHDGRSTLEAAFDGITEKGRRPGLVIVKSAGNERTHRGHARVYASTSLIETISWESREVDRPMDYIEGWYNGFDDLGFVLVSPSGARSETLFFDFSSFDNDPTVPITIASELDGNPFTLSLTQNHRDNDSSLIQIIIQKKNFPVTRIKSGEWQLDIIGRNVTTDGRVDFWIERTNRRALKFMQGANDEMTLSVPGTAETVITVAACRVEGPPLRLNKFSSYGPTREKRPKPEITAPGENIFSANSNTDDPTSGVSMTGTSMAAPHVAGAIALALSKRQKSKPNQQLNANQIQQELIRNAVSAGPNHHPGLGFGILDVESFLRRL